MVLHVFIFGECHGRPLVYDTSSLLPNTVMSLMSVIHKTLNFKFFSLIQHLDKQNLINVALKCGANGTFIAVNEHSGISREEASRHH